MAFDPYQGKAKRERYANLRSKLWSDRSSFDPHWRELSEFIMPRRSRFTSNDRNRGDKRNQSIIDSTGRFAARTLSSGLHAGLTSPARPWMNLTTPDPDLAEFGPVKEWLHIVTKRMLAVFTQTNLYNVFPMVYGDMGVFATAAMAMLEDSKDLFRCYSYPVGSYAFGLDGRGVVSTFVRDYELSVRQVVELFGWNEDKREIDWSNISLAVKAAWDAGDYENAVPLTWVVMPNVNANKNRLESRYLPFSSCHFETNDQGSDAGLKLLRESGFRSFPVMGPRWDITGEDAYGTDCPGMTALGDIKQLQIMQRRKAQAINKMVDPPLVGPTSLMTQKTSLLAGDITYLDGREGMQGLKPIHEVRLDVSQLAQDIGETQWRIQRAFYEDLFLMLARSDDRGGVQPPTAREVEERHEEKLIALGPVLERTNDELLDPVVDRAYAMMEAAGMIPPAPEQLEGVNLKVEYTSIMAQAQKLVGVTGSDRFLQTSMGMLELFPQVRHKLKVFQIVDNYADMLGVDPRTIVPTEEAEAAMAEEIAGQKAQADAEQAVNIAKATKLAGDTNMEGDTALNRMTSAVAAGVV